MILIEYLHILILLLNPIQDHLFFFQKKGFVESVLVFASATN